MTLQVLVILRVVPRLEAQQMRSKATKNGQDPRGIYKEENSALAPDQHVFSGFAANFTILMAHFLFTSVFV